MIKIGRYCSIASGASLFGVEHQKELFTSSSLTRDRQLIIFNDPTQHNTIQYHTIRTHIDKHIAISIENDVWIAGGVSIKPGVTIGNGSVIGARAVIAKDVPPYAVVVGNPGRIIKYRFSDEVIADLLQLRWWEYDFHEFPIFNDIEITEFISVINSEIKNGNLKPFTPEKLMASELKLL